MERRAPPPASTVGSGTRTTRPTRPFERRRHAHRIVGHVDLLDPLGGRRAGATKLRLRAGVAHYDEPPPDVLEDLEALRLADRFRFANRAPRAGSTSRTAIVGHGQSGGGLIGSTTLRLGKKEVVFEAIALPDLHPEPVVGAPRSRFVQTAGGRTGVPAPRRG